MGKVLSSDFWTAFRIGSLTYIESEFDFKISFTGGGTHNGMTFTDCLFNESIEFLNIEFNDEVIFQNCTFKKSLHFKGSTFQNTLRLHDITSNIIYFHAGQYNFTSIKPKNVNRLQIEGGDFKNKLWLTDETLDNSRVISQIYFNFDRISGNIDIDLIHTNHILLNGINKTNFSLADGKIDRLEFHNFFNAGYLTIDWWRRDVENAVLVIENSNLKNVQITNSFLANLRKFNLTASNLTELILINCTLKYDLEPSEKHITNWERQQSLKDSFRQLKNAMALQKDRVNELVFYSLEMKAYYQMLSWRNNFWTKLILGFDKVSSNHGQNLRSALFFLFGIHFFLYALLIKVSHYNGIIFTFDFSNLQYFWRSFGDYLQLLIPTHHFDENETGGGARVIDFCMRFFSSLLIYNVIRTGRRFARS